MKKAKKEKKYVLGFHLCVDLFVLYIRQKKRGKWTCIQGQGGGALNIIFWFIYSLSLVVN